MIITIGREFGSGGREVGKRLADELGIPYYDREIITKIAEAGDLDEKLIEGMLESGTVGAPALTFGHTLSVIPVANANLTQKIMLAQQTVIRALAVQDCVIVGRCADQILADLHPFRIFVYANDQAKLARCRARAPQSEHLNDRALLREIHRIDNGRRRTYKLYFGKEWGHRENYDLCVNTSSGNIKEIVSCIARYIRRA